MIVQSPESGMPEPFKTYVKKRNDFITKVLGEVAGDSNIQLCPRAITPDERIFPESNGHVYGAVVKKIEDGYKSILYSESFGYRNGITTSDQDEAISYVKSQVEKGNKVRIKDPRESDSQGQHTIESVDQMTPIFNEITKNTKAGCVLMPYLSEILQRVSIGRISLGELGDYTYFGREETVLRDNVNVYGGTKLGLFRSNSNEDETKIREYFEISPQLAELGKSALDKYSKVTISSGRVSVDVIEGITNNGEIIRDVIDITPRVGGTTPAEVLAIREIYNQNSLCIASSRLIYNPTSLPDNGFNILNTSSLVINAQIHDVIR